MVWQIIHGLDLNVKESLLTRSPFLEMDSLQGTTKTTKAMARKNLVGLRKCGMIDKSID